MPCWVYAKHESLARGKGVHIFLDISKPGPDNWGVAITYLTRIYALRTGVNQAEALDLAEEQCCLPGPEGDSSWCSVLARLLRKSEAPGEWYGSAAERASQFFDIGTWNWLVTVMDFRRSKQQGGEPHEISRR